jgi:hypothetical protein
LDLPINRLAPFAQGLPLEPLAITEGDVHSPGGCDACLVKIGAQRMDEPIEAFPL